MIHRSGRTVATVSLLALLPACSFADDESIGASADATATVLEYRGAIPRESGLGYTVALRYEGEMPADGCYELHSYGGGQYRPPQRQVSVSVQLRDAGNACQSPADPVVIDPLYVTVESPGAYVAVAPRAGRDSLEVEFVVPEL